MSSPTCAECGASMLHSRLKGYRCSRDEQHNGIHREKDTKPEMNRLTLKPIKSVLANPECKWELAGEIPGINGDVQLPFGSPDEAREWLAAWMIKNDYATGHGDTVDELVCELYWQAAERLLDSVERNQP